jgi:hypothetical protein
MFSSLQIKFGYPNTIKRPVFVESTNLFNRTAVKVYFGIPFLWELKAIFDWTMTKTTFDIFEWFIFEDAYANLYKAKASMESRRTDGSIYDKRPWWIKFF